MNTNDVKNQRMGWLRDLPDFRDYTPEHKKIQPMLAKMNVARTVASASLPASVDLRVWCSPIEDQQDLGSCTTQAGAGLISLFKLEINGV